MPAVSRCVSAKIDLLYTRCDLGSVADVAGAVLAASGGGAQPLTGILHAGGVLEDAALRNQMAAHVRHVFAPKLSAAMALAQVCTAVDSARLIGRSLCSPHNALPHKPLLHVTHGQVVQGSLNQ